MENEQLHAIVKAAAVEAIEEVGGRWLTVIGIGAFFVWGGKTVTDYLNLGSWATAGLTLIVMVAIMIMAGRMGDK